MKMRFERCSKCNDALRYMKRRNERNAITQKSVDSKKWSISSHVNTKYLSPTSQKRRSDEQSKNLYKLAANSVSAMRERIQRCGLAVLNKKQHAEMVEISQKISTEYEIELQEVKCAPFLLPHYNFGVHA
jgi:hypothetical protein